MEDKTTNMKPEIALKMYQALAQARLQLHKIQNQYSSVLFKILITTNK